MSTGLERPTESRVLQGIFIPSGADMPLALAELFCALYNDQQAAFLDHVAQLSKNYPNPPEFQWRSMMEHMTPAAHALLHSMIEHTDEVRS